MKRRLLLFFIVTILGIGLFFCRFFLWSHMFDEPIPDREIVFAAPGATGFMHPDGSGQVLLDGGLSWSQWAGKQGDYLVWRGPYERISSARGNGLVKECYRLYVKDRSAIPGTDNLIAVLVEGGKYKLVKINFKRCKKIAEYRELPNAQVHLGTNPVHGDDIIYVQNYLDSYENTYSEEKTQLVLFNTKTGEQRIIKEQIVKRYSTLQSIFESPAFSPNGQWIAYTDAQGIRLIRPDGSEDHMLVEVLGWYLNGSVAWPPAASFSPDGQWIVFHRCPWDGCSISWDIGPGKIYKVNIQTGEETLLFDGGGNPFWRLTSHDE